MPNRDRPAQSVIYLDPSVHERISQAAKAESRSIKGFVQHHLMALPTVGLVDG